MLSSSVVADGSLAKPLDNQAFVKLTQRAASG
jgi:hypothetical protein